MNSSSVAYCGLCCDDCHAHNGKIPDLARDLRKELRATRYEKFASFMAKSYFGQGFKEYPKAYETLGAMVKFRCRRGCRNGGGNPACRIRKCAQKKGYEGCFQCVEFESCEKLEFLKPVHDDAHLKNLRLIKKKGVTKFLKGRRNW